MKHQRAGFTLIELLIVIVIVGLLATIATSFFWSARDRALSSTMQADLKTVASHQESYFGEAMTYAATVADLVEFQPSPGVMVNITFADATGWAAQVTHPSYAGHTCGIFVGDAPAADGAPATLPGQIACD